MITVTRISNLPELMKLQSEWNELLSRIPNPSVFMTWEWLITWWEVYGKNNWLWWLIARDEAGTLVGGAPFYLTKHQNGLILPHRELRFIGTGSPVCPEHLDVLSIPAHSDQSVIAFANYLAVHFSDWDVLLLADLASSSALAFRLIEELSEKGAMKLTEEQTPGIFSISLPNSWDGYVKSLSKSMRQVIVSGRNKLSQKHQARFHVWSPSDGTLDGVFSEFEALFTARKQSVGLDNKFQEDGYQEFHRELAKKFAKRGWLYLAFLRFGEKAVAAHYTFQYGESFYAYQFGFDPVFGKNNVFKVLRSYVIEDAISQGIKTFDLLRGEESYKRDWKAIYQKKYQLRSFSPTFYGRALNGILKLRRTGKRAAQMLGLVGAKS